MVQTSTVFVLDRQGTDRWAHIDEQSLTFTRVDNLKSSVNRTRLFWNVKRKPEYTGRNMLTPHRRPWGKIRTQNLRTVKETCKPLGQHATFQSNRERNFVIKTLKGCCDLQAFPRRFYECVCSGGEPNVQIYFLNAHFSKPENKVYSFLISRFQLFGKTLNQKCVNIQ